jgi:S1-C subfamily serine protease
MIKTRELSLIVVIVFLVAVIVIQSITNIRILSLIGKQPQQLELPFLSTILNEAKQLQKQVTGQNNNNGDCEAVAANTTSFAKPSSPHSPSQILSLTGMFKQVENSVVQITSTISDPSMQIIINGNPLEGQSTRLGSGFIYDKQGYIISNNHVVGSAKKVDVTFVDGNTYAAKVIGTDPFSDIAVIKIIDDFSTESVLPLVIANSSSLQVGQQVIAIGNPFGLSDTMTTGIVSQMGRLLPDPETGFSMPNGIQTDAAINPGNSGGPLLNMHGHVIGMNTSISSSTGEFSGIGFAIPSNTIIREVPALLQKGCYSHAWLGISGGSLNPDLAESIGLSRNYKGVVVGPIQAGSPAEKAGLKGVTQDEFSNTHRVGDIITGIDGHSLRSIDDLITYIDVHKSVGNNVVLTVDRHGQIINLNAVLQPRPLSLESTTPQESILP